MAKSQAAAKASSPAPQAAARAAARTSVIANSPLNIKTQAFPLGAATSAAGAGLPGALTTPEATKDPGLISGLTPEQRQEVIDQAGDFTKQEKGFAKQPYSAGGISLTGSSQNNQKKAVEQAKIQAIYQTNLQKFNGDTAAAQAATKKQWGRVQAGDKTFKQLGGGGAATYLNTNASNYGITVDPFGKYTASKFNPGQINESGGDIRSGIEDLNRTGVDETSGLIGDVSGDISGALDFRSGARQGLSSLMGDMNNEGLTPEQEQAINMQSQQDLSNYGDTFNRNINSVVGKMQGNGVLNSSLFGDNLRQGAFKSFGDFLGNMQANTANQRVNFKNQAANRNIGRLQAMNQTFSGAGAGSLNDLSNPYMNAGNLGMMTDPQSTNAAIALRGQDQAQRNNVQSNTQGALKTTSLQNNSANAGWMDVAGSVAGSLGGAAVAGMLP
jgi:hypothetical protein